MGGFSMNDNGERDYVDYIRDSFSGFLSVKLPVKRGPELSVNVS
jgi:hypothetical protein